MSNISLIIEERAANIGNFLVGRLLPFRQKRMVGPFIFIDHMGPVFLKDHENFDIGPHPHIGLSTLTYLFEGSIMHRDSIGSALEIKPGAVNWMTAGRGVVHSERTPEYLRHSEKSLHGLQIWVALPKEFEDIEPSFFHIEADKMPTWSIEHATIKLIAGTAFGKSSKVPVFSPLYFIEIKTSETGQTLNIGDDLYGESALYILEGSINTEGNEFGPKQILIAENSKLCSFTMQENTTVYIFGGEQFLEDRYIDWNFVSSDKEKLKKAKEDWINGTFPTIEGETDLVPYPIRK
jgi:redox-sensitive bicupin YhaK (pirin superfamily)